MLVLCSKCKTTLRVSDERIGPEGSKFKCPNCSAVLIVKKPSAIKEEKDISKPVIEVEKDTGLDYKESTQHSSEQERRKYKRFDFREDILVDGTKQCTIMDISEGGLYVSAIQHFEEKSVIDVTIPCKGGKLTVKAQVQYCQPGIGMGIELVDLNDEQRTKIKELIGNI